MNLYRFTVYKHELQALKECFDVNIKLSAGLIRKMRMKDQQKYSSVISHVQAIVELMQDYSMITADHILIGEDMEFELEAGAIQALIRHMEIILTFGQQKVPQEFEGLENIHRICADGISDIETISTIYKRMKVALYMNNSYPA